MTPAHLLEQMMLSLMLLGGAGPQAATPTCVGMDTCRPTMPVTSQLSAHDTTCERLLQRHARFAQLAQEGGHRRKIERLAKQSRAVQEHAQRLGCNL